ncbi:hypothetical protein QT972_10635 [Microcoleus sp. herbarium7]|uniref:hypothetical protein n=1 Tax=unclassified Microcoleus TaxID=2642155 RepID=UPI002FCF5A8A
MTIAPFATCSIDPQHRIYPDRRRRWHTVVLGCASFPFRPDAQSGAATETKPAANNRGSDRHFLSGEPEGIFTNPDWGFAAVFATGRSTKLAEKSAFKSPCVQKKLFISDN